MKFKAVKLTTELEQCAACRILLHKGDGVMMASDGKVHTFVCDEFCVVKLKKPSRNEKRIDYLTLKFN